MKSLCIILFLIAYQVTSAQESSLTVFEETPQDDQLFQLEEREQYHATQNINKVNSIDLLATGLLTKEQAEGILNYRREHGKLISLYELQVISSISTDTLKLLAQQLHIPFFDVHQPQQILKESMHYSLLRWERKTERSKGYTTNSKGIRSYPGEDYRLLYRFRSSFSNLYYVGISLEKDAGESWIWSPPQKQFYFDYTSAYLIIHPQKTIEQIAVGDFLFRSGHGLIFGGNLIQSKNPEYWQSTWQIGHGFRPHSSSSEYGFYRGIGTKIQTQRIGLSTFFSKSPQDGTLQNDGSISGINTSGLHRSTSEVSKRKNFFLTQTGTVLSYQNINQSLKIDLEYLYSHYQYPLNPSSNYYNQSYFRGQEHHVIGIDLQYHYHGGTVFTELALSSKKGKSIYGGLLHNLSKQHTWMLFYWSSNAHFESFQGNIPTNNTRIGNESGIYQALLLQLSAKVKLSSGFSVSQSQQASFGKKGPTYGCEWINRLTYQLKKKTSLFIQFRTTQQEETNDSNTIRPQHRYYLVGDVLQKEDRHWELHSRVQLGFFQFSEREESYCISQSIGYHFNRYRIKVQCSVFESPSWDSRLYAYEPDVPMAFSIPALSGNGIRMCWVATVKPVSKVELSFKVAHITYTHAQKTGSGYDEVEGNKQTEIKIQARFYL